MIKLINLRIKNYKNFIDTTINFSSTNNYCAIIGLNSSGKSNLLEVISIIFASIYNKRVENIYYDYETDLKFEIIYKINDIEVKVSTISSVRYKTKNLDNLDFYKRSEAVFYRGEHTPSQVIANYSGEELRLWNDIYFNFYDAYFNKMKTSNSIIDKKMIYINKFNWQMALVTLLSYDDKIILEMLKQENVDNINVKFSFDTTKYASYKTNQIIEFIDEINPNRDTIVMIDLLGIRFNNILNIETNNKQKHINLFNFLYIAFMPEDNKIITEIEVEFNNMTSKSLSEGEKKIILIRLITTILADNKTLLIFDEPDSHIHISRKKELAKILKELSQYSVLTTHSAALINFLDDNSIRLLRPDINDGVKCEEANKFTHIEAITDNSINLLDTSLIISTHKDILMCEGVNDLNYIKKALEVLNRTQDNKYKALENLVMINCGGADNVVPVFEEIVLDYLKEEQICICLFDYDDQGKKNKKKIEDVVSNIPNVKASYHPCIDIEIDQTKDPDKDTKFLMENYFSVSSYRDRIIKSFNKKNDFKSLSEFQNPKSVISGNYKNFNDNDFINFSVLFDKLLYLFNLVEEER